MTFLWREFGLPDSAPNSLLQPLSAMVIRDANLRTGYQRAAAKEDGKKLVVIVGKSGVTGVQLR